MKNTLKNLLQKTVAGMLVVSSVVGFAACTPPREEEKDDDNTVLFPDTETKPEAPKFTVVEGKYFVENGVSDYVIVYAPESRCIPNNTVTPDGELITFFAEATGVTLTAYADGETVPEGKKIISIGETSYAEAANITGAKMSSESFRIVSDDSNVYIVGEGYGVLWGVYELLECLFGYTFYKENVWYIDRGVRTLNFIDIDNTVVPNIAYSPAYHSTALFGNNVTAYRLRHHSERTLMVEYYHNALLILDPAVYGADHANWYSTGNDQLCYNARGNADELAAMTETVAQYFAKLLRENTAVSYASFSMMDTHSWCACEACIESETKYQSKSAAMLILSQNIALRINEILHDEGDTRDIKILTMIYNAAEDVPVSVNEKGEYQLIDSSLDFSNVIPLWAVMSMKSHEKAWTDPENAAAFEMLKKIDACFDEFWVWDYCVNFRDYLIPINVFNNIEEDFKILKQFNISLYLYQGDHTAQNASTFGSLRTYLLSEYMMNPNQDIDVLTEKYFENVYGAGADAMKEIYDRYRILAAYNSEDHGDVLAWDESIYSSTMLSAEYFPRGVLRDWLALLDDAYEAIEAKKSENANAYYKYEENIKLDSIFIRYIYACLYLTTNNEENIEFKLQLYNDVVALGFGSVSESQGGTWNLAVSLGIDQYLN